MSNMNPQITTVQVGVKSLREITLYPLSMADQFQMTDLIKEEISTIIGTDFTEITDFEATELVLDAIKRNLSKLLTYVLDKEDSVDFNEITNTQFVDIVQKLYDINFDVVVKNLQTLKQKFPMLMSQLNAPSVK